MEESRAFLSPAEDPLHINQSLDTMPCYQRSKHMLRKDPVRPAQKKSADDWAFAEVIANDSLSLVRADLLVERVHDARIVSAKAELVDDMTNLQATRGTAYRCMTQDPRMNKQGITGCFRLRVISRAQCYYIHQNETCDET